MQITRDGIQLIIQSQNFDPKQTLECGQVFRYNECGDNDYIIYAGANRARIFKSEGSVHIESDELDYFEHYFDLSTDYGDIINKLQGFSELTSSVNACSGIRILNQDIFETIISFIISANNNIGRIKGIIERLCTKCGTDMGGYHAFPTREQLLRLSVQNLRELGAGFRAEYIFSTVRLMEGDFIDRLSHGDNITTYKLLLSLKGVGPKVADCIMLFALRRTNSYPVDTWIFKANKTAELDTPQKVHDYFSARYGDLAGYAQQYIFYHTRSGG